MKTSLQKFTACILLLLFAAVTANAQVAETKPAKRETIQIKTSAECDMCKDRLLKEMGNTAGVKKAELDLGTRVLTVTYATKKVSADQIRQAIAKIGYDADDVKANNKAFKKLPDCCQKGSGVDCKPGDGHKHEEGK